MKTYQTGSITAESLCLGTVLSLMMLLPVPGQDDQSLASWLVENLRSNHQAWVFGLANPDSE